MIAGDAVQRRLGTAALFLAAFTLWLLNHPYVGLWHDSQIYAVIAANRLRPNDYANELFFAFGSQGDLTIYAWLFAPLVGYMGLDHASQAVVLAGGAGWIAAMLWLSRAGNLPASVVVFMTLCAGLMTINYSPNGSVFNFPESFATPRALAISLGVASVAAWLAKRKWPALLLSLLSLCMHPLMGVWPLALVVLLWAGLRTGAMLCLLVLAGFVLAGVLDLDLPLVRLMPEQWLHFARDHSPDAWFRADGETRIETYLAHLTVLVAAAVWAAPENRRLYGGMALMTLTALAMAWLSAFVWPVEIVLQGQPWRVFWLAAVLAGMGGLDMLAYQVRRIRRYAKPVGMVALLVLLAYSPLWWADVELASGQFINPWWADDSALNGFVAGGLWQTGAILATAAWLAGRVAPSSRQAALAVTILLVGGAMAWVLPHWDRRVPWLAEREFCFLNDSCSPHPFRSVMKPGELVYWPGDETRVWLELRQPTYLSGNQRAGGVFSQRKSVEAERRTRHGAQYSRPLDAVRLCADPVMDWIVAGGTVIAGATAASAGGMHLHRCAALRAVPPSL